MISIDRKGGLFLRRVCFRFWVKDGQSAYTCRTVRLLPVRPVFIKFVLGFSCLIRVVFGSLSGEVSDGPHKAARQSATQTDDPRKELGQSTSWTDGPRFHIRQSAPSWRTVRATLTDSPPLPGSFGLDLPSFDSRFRCLFLGSFLEVLSV